MSLEHIWPQSLGGTASPSLFQSHNVCKTCNDLAGLWIDGAFIKGWFVSNESAMASRLYFDPNSPGIAPLHYMGIDQKFPCEPKQVCERWVGQAGEHIYHIHPEDDDKWYGYAGGDILQRKADNGRAYLILTSQNAYWSLTALRSFIAHFKNSRLFCLTQVAGMPENLASSFVNNANATPIETRETNWIKARPDDETHHMRLSLRLDFSDRFLAKLSLGLGANIFSSDYLLSPYAEELRKLLWQRKPNANYTPSVRGTNLWQERNLEPLARFTGWPGAWTILLYGAQEGFLLYLSTPGERGMSMVISDDNSLWTAAEFNAYREGIMYFVIPERGVFIGPVPLPHYLAHRLGNFVDPQLASLEALRIDPTKLPVTY